MLSFYFLVTFLTTMTPGTGKILTINNILKYGYKEMSLALIGMFMAVLFISISAAFGINILITKFPNVYLGLQIFGAFYIFYLSYSQYYSKDLNFTNPDTLLNFKDKIKFIKEGFFITIINPKQFVFFGGLFPQFIIIENDYWSQIYILISIFLFLFVVTHYIYAFGSSFIKKKFSHHSNFQTTINKVLSAVYFIFASVMLYNILSNT